MYSSTLEAPVLLLGAAHVVDLEGPIRSTLQGRTLDAIAVELDDERARALLTEGTPGRPGGGGPFFLRLWAVVQRRLGGEFGAGIAGAEMRSAATLAKERGIPLLLIDDPIRETVAHLIGSLSFRERILLVVGSIVGLVNPLPHRPDGDRPVRGGARRLRGAAAPGIPGRGPGPARRAERAHGRPPHGGAAQRVRTGRGGGRGRPCPGARRRAPPARRADGDGRLRPVAGGHNVVTVSLV